MREGGHSIGLIDTEIRKDGDGDERRIWDESGAYRAILTAGLRDAICVLHAFQKKMRVTPKREIQLATECLDHLMRGES